MSCAATRFTIAEAAERSGLTAHTLRYYERDGLMLAAVDRSGSDHRRYTERDLTWISLITKLRSTGMPIREVKKYAALVRAGDGN
jgi:DNA-binding transcriptional MerR regulator